VDLRQEFGDCLKEQREAAGLTQERLAELAGMDRTTISLYERGERMPGLDSILKLIKGLDLSSTDDLLGTLLGVV
jgi:transcriptional regulator with XRE-family HTH domain